MEEKKVEERVSLVIDEEHDDKVKDVNFSVNTMSSGEASFTTGSINGILAGIIISCRNTVGIKVTLANTDIVVFEIPSFQGEQFIPMRLGVVSSVGESFRDGFTKWTLNDMLSVEVKGQFNSEVFFKVRYK